MATQHVRVARERFALLRNLEKMLSGPLALQKLKFLKRNVLVAVSLALPARPTARRSTAIRTRCGGRR
ncbi:MAG: hypothetical protein JO078_07255 [Candidatus Eremiobacteraeota bacterium]|nr:hypothetical protein [Candidatus Eremiobacteraeota bacterium]MBV9699906.1 hypothetical protein [Candidatus Eremiobacteraeota bacterium]